MDTLYNDKLTGVIDKAFFEDRFSKTRIRQDEIKEKLSELEIQRDDWEGRVERIISIVDSLKDFKSKFIEVDDQKKIKCLG